MLSLLLFLFASFDVLLLAKSQLDGDCYEECMTQCYTMTAVPQYWCPNLCKHCEKFWSLLPTRCSQAEGFIGKYVGGSCNSATGIQSVCTSSGTTLDPINTWKRGVNVKMMCTIGASPLKYAPIASISSQNGIYDMSNSNDHAAIFVSCDSKGITVLDQYCNKEWNYRVIKFTNTGDKSDGGSYFTI